MDDIDRSPTKNCVVLVQSIDRVAGITALFEADNVRMTIVPAAGTLTQIAAKRANIPNLWRCDRFSSLCQNGVVVLNGWVCSDIGKRHERTDGQARSRPP